MVAKAALAHFRYGRGVSSMVAALLIAGVGLVLAGLVTVGLGIQLDLSFGNTLILTGAVVACTGAILLGLWMVMRELKNLARQQLGSGISLGSPAADTRAVLAATLGDQAPEDGGFLFGRDQPAVENAGGNPAAQSGSPPPRREDAASGDPLRG